MSDYKCASCSATDIQKLSMVYQAGTSVINARTSGTSTGIGMARGGLGIGTARSSSRTTGTQMTELAKRAAPPKKAVGLGWIAIGLFGSFLVAMLFGILMTLLFLGACGFFAWKGIKHNGNIYPDLRAAWERSWLCHRCGAIFQAGDTAAIAQQPTALL